MIINGIALLDAAPIVDMVKGKMVGPGGTSFGLGEAGYDIRLAEEVLFEIVDGVPQVTVNGETTTGRFALASALDVFTMPTDLVGIVHDKSTNARRALSVFNTVIEPGWNGKLTLELVFHGQERMLLPKGGGIAQVIFHKTSQEAQYTGRYQNQEAGPQSARGV